MNVLLDTNALIKVLASDKPDFGSKTQLLIAQADNVYASSISIVELRIKAMLGKLKLPDNLLELIQTAHIKYKSFDVSEADGVSMFPELVRHDPFDRMLLAQAQTANLVFVTSDTLLIDLGLSYVVDLRT